MNKLIELIHLTAGYDRKTVLRDISLTVYEQDFLGIIGPNGGGKTTLLKVILGLLAPQAGEIHRKEGLKIGYLPQMSQIDRRFPISVHEVIASGLAAEKPRFRGYNTVQQQRIEEVVCQMGLEALAHRSVAELSGGQLLILDEPNSYVDKRFESKFYQLLEEINHESAVVLVSHDIGTVLSMVKNIACVNETLHYHAGTDIAADWLDQNYACPIELVGHGNLPHRVLKNHPSAPHEP